MSEDSTSSPQSPQPGHKHSKETNPTSTPSIRKAGRLVMALQDLQRRSSTGSREPEVVQQQMQLQQQQPDDGMQSLLRGLQEQRAQLQQQWMQEDRERAASARRQIRKGAKASSLGAPWRRPTAAPGQFSKPGMLRGKYLEPFQAQAATRPAKLFEKHSSLQDPFLGSRSQSECFEQDWKYLANASADSMASSVLSIGSTADPLSKVPDSMTMPQSRLSLYLAGNSTVQAVETLPKWRLTSHVSRELAPRHYLDEQLAMFAGSAKTAPLSMQSLSARG